MFGIGTSELMIILAVGLIVIGPQKLPDLAKAIGRAVGEFRKATSEIKETLEGDENLASVKQTFEEAMQEGMKSGLSHTEKKEDLDNAPYSVAEKSGPEETAPKAGEEGAGSEEAGDAQEQPGPAEAKAAQEPEESPQGQDQLKAQAQTEEEPESAPAEEHGSERKSDA